MNAKLNKINPDTPSNAPIQSTAPPMPTPIVWGIEGNAIRRVTAFLMALIGVSEAFCTKRIQHLLQPPYPLRVNELSKQNFKDCSTSGTKGSQSTC